MDRSLIKIDLKNIRFEPGYWNGLRQPAFIFELQLAEQGIRKTVLERYDRIADTLLPKRRAHTHSQIVTKHPLLTRLAGTATDILATAGMPIMSSVNALPIRRQNTRYWLFGLPAVSADIDAPKWAMMWSVELMNSLDEDEQKAIEDLQKDLQKLILLFKQQAPSGINTLRFLQAAHDEGVPWRHVANNVYQFGWGSRSRWLDSSFTDETPRISAGLARDKLACSRVLRSAGLPVLRHRQVVSEEQALATADALGYPVVVKPADLDGGRGVFTQLQTPSAVQRAYSEAAKLSKRILVEKHFEGNDYRLQVYKGEVFWVVHRRPAYVIGDGKTSIESLIQFVNHEREHAPYDFRVEQGMKPIIVDDEVQGWLAKQDLAISSIPMEGQHVRLRGAANVGSGGTREPVLQKAHPDNLALASRAAQVMRLDLAGIDLLIPDISRSWYETGAAICEVNGQPQMSPPLHQFILSRLVKKKGRVPVVVILGECSKNIHELGQELLDATRLKGFRLGWSSFGKMSVGGESLGLADASVQAGCGTLLADPRVDAIAWQLPKRPSINDGMPFDYIDLLILLGRVEDSVDSSVIQLEKRAGCIWSVDPGIRAGTDDQDLKELPLRISSWIANQLTL